MLKLNKQMSKVRVTVQQIVDGKAQNGSGWSVTLYETDVAEVRGLIEKAVDAAAEAPVAEAPAETPAPEPVVAPEPETVTPEPVVAGTGKANGKVKELATA